jgi:hypothetical protein
MHFDLPGHTNGSIRWRLLAASYSSTPTQFVTDAVIRRASHMLSCGHSSPCTLGSIESHRFLRAAVLMPPKQWPLQHARWQHRPWRPIHVQQTMVHGERCKNGSHALPLACTTAGPDDRKLTTGARAGCNRCAADPTSSSKIAAPVTKLALDALSLRQRLADLRTAPYPYAVRYINCSAVAADSCPNDH